MRQQILILCLVNSSLNSRVISWSFWDGTGKAKTFSGDSDEPPYERGLDALLDGWCLIQVSPAFAPPKGSEYKTDFFYNEFIFEKRIEETEN